MTPRDRDPRTIAGWARDSSRGAPCSGAILTGVIGALLPVLVAGCASARGPGGGAPGSPDGAATDARAGPSADDRSVVEQRSFERDREAILAMAGDYDVSFRFRETVPFRESYEPKEPFRSGGHEVVRVIEDTGEFISLQHILVVGKEDKRAIKHWRQDWIYEPDHVLVYIGGNAWRKRPVSDAEAEGKWAQIVYQVDDSPRYGALATWSHDQGVSEWEPPAEWRPLPRRDATMRDDYHAIDGVNRHAITPFGWVHEQDNSKLVLTGGEPELLVREIGVNSYRRDDDIAAHVAEDYWAGTKEFWAAVRAEWERIAAGNRRFGLTIPGEPEPLYTELLELADEVKSGETGLQAAVREAPSVIERYTTTDVGTLAERLERGEKGE